jgi:hypothetical protein
MPGSKYQQTNTGRPWSEVRGYLRDSLGPAEVTSGELTPTAARIAVYSTNAAGEWRYNAEATVWNYDESGIYAEGLYVRASLNPDNRFEVYWVSCSATDLTIPESPIE